MTHPTLCSFFIQCTWYIDCVVVLILAVLVSCGYIETNCVIPSLNIVGVGGPIRLTSSINDSFAVQVDYFERESLNSSINYMYSDSILYNMFLRFFITLFEY